MNLLRAAFSVSAMTFLSRVTGLVREIIAAGLFGAGPAMDAFLVAWRLPNFLRRLFAEGAFSQAFVPIFAEYRNRRGKDETHLLADHVASLLSLILLGVSVVGVLAAPLLVYLTASGFAASGDKFELAVMMTRITFPYILFISLVSLAAGILNTWSAYKTPAFTPVLLNLCVIAAAIWLAPHVNPPIVALAWGVLLGGLVQLSFQLPALRRIGMLPRISWRWSALRAARADEGVTRTLKLMAPAILGVSVAQISILLNTQIASFLGDGAVSWISYADRLMEFPSALLGVAIGTVLLPALAKEHARTDVVEYSRLLDWGLRLTLLLTLPAAVALALLATPLLATLFQRGAFAALDVTMTSRALVAYAVGLTGIILVKVLAPGFYARQNVRTPVKIALFTLVCTQLLNLALVPWLRHAGLALATGLGACLNAALLYWFMRKHRIYQPEPGWPLFVLKLIVALCLLGCALWWLRGDEAAWLSMGLAAKCLKLAVVIAAGTATYFAGLWLMGIRPNQFKRAA